MTVSGVTPFEVAARKKSRLCAAGANSLRKAAEVLNGGRFPLGSLQTRARNR